jgi:uncharacterized protein
VRDDEIRRRLRETNPWWQAAGLGRDATAWTASDRVLRERSQWDLGYRSDVLNDVAHEPVNDRLLLLRGPRRVGKSVVLKDTAAALCGRSDVNPLQVIYLPLDGMRKADLNRVAVLGRELTRAVGDHPRVWLLDEIAGVAGWTEQLKYLRDNTEFGSDTVVCTGSSWSDQADTERNLFAGRAGTTSTKRTRLVLPMTFREYTRASGRELPNVDVVEPWDLQGPEARHAAIRVEHHVDELDLAWQSYLTCGGFPRAVAEYESVGHVSAAFLDDLGAWLHRDVDPDSGEDSVPLLLHALLQRSTSPLNRNNTARALGYPSRQTFDLRLNRLTRSFAGLWCHQVDETGKRVGDAQSKYYLTDPLLGWLPTMTRAGIDSPDFTQLSEGAIAVALARAVDNADPGRWIANDSIGYIRTGEDNEIDFAPVPIRAGGVDAATTPLESKWVSGGWRKEALSIENKFGRGVLATKDIIDIGGRAWALPAPLVSLLLE